MVSTFDEFFLTDEKKSLEGVRIIVGYNQNDNEVALWVAEAGNKKHEKVQRKFSKALEKTRHNKDKQREIMAKIIAESLLLDWEGVLDDKGEAIPCTLENKIKALTKYKKLFLEVLENSSDAENFQVDTSYDDAEATDDAEEDSLKN